MPLSPSAPRELIHTRAIECLGYRRADGLWEIEARIRDTKTYPFKNRWRGEVVAGAPLHDMQVRLTIDENFTIHGAEATTDASPHRICPEAAPPMAALEGLKIAPGWIQAVKAKLGGTHGCTHLVELLGPMATTAFQTLYPVLAKRAAEATPDARPRMIDSCYAWSAERDLIREFYPTHYTGTGPQPGADLGATTAKGTAS